MSVALTVWLVQRVCWHATVEPHMAYYSPVCPRESGTSIIYEPTMRAGRKVSAAAPGDSLAKRPNHNVADGVPGYCTVHEARPGPKAE